MTRDAVYLVMDMINDLVHPDGPNGAKGFGPQVQQTQVVEYTATALAKARAAGVRVGYVRIGFSPDYLQCPPDSPRFAPARAAGLFKLGTWGTEVHPLLSPAPGGLRYHQAPCQPVLWNRPGAHPAGKRDPSPLSFGRFDKRRRPGRDAGRPRQGLRVCFN